MSYIVFGRLRTSDFGLIVAPYEIPMPPAQTNFVEVPGRNGSLDLTEAFGGVRYGDRVINLTLYAVGDYRARLFEFTNLFHGQRFPIVFDKDPDYTYTGRIDVSAIKKHDAYTEVSVTITAEPYKLEAEETTVSVTNSGRANLVNGAMPVTPVIKTTAETMLQFTYNGTSMTVRLSEGEHVVPQLTLEANSTIRVTVASTGTTTFAYRKGWL